ncbi:MAG: hypothetical protein JW910_14300 [Anaerolineae bacterium]|nr:hypothetical protein [Anaerolineae bacterium]
MGNLATIKAMAERLLAQDPAPAVRMRLLRDVLGQPVDDATRNALDASRWVKLLAAEQRADGSWGRFHSQDAAAKQRVITTEFGVERALALGLDADHPVLERAAVYLELLLAGDVPFPDPAERNDRWLTGVQLFVASTLALVRPDHPVLEPVRALWLEIARRTFAGGTYDAAAEIAAHEELTGASVKDSYLTLRGKYQLALLSSQPDALDPATQRALLIWLWSLPDGVGYQSVPLAVPPPAKAGPFDRWFSSLELLSRFPAWREFAGTAVEWLWAQRRADGDWDCGARAPGSVVLPLAEDWRGSGRRARDWTARVLCLLDRYYEPPESRQRVLRGRCGASSGRGVASSLQKRATQRNVDTGGV